MIDQDGRGGGAGELMLLAVVGLLATVVRLASDPPRSLARMAWLGIAGLGMSTGGWLVAKAAGMDRFATRLYVEPVHMTPPSEMRGARPAGIGRSTRWAHA